MTDLPDVIVITDDQTSVTVVIDVPDETVPDVITVEVPDETVPDVIEINTGYAGPTGKTSESASWTYMGTLAPYIGLGRWVYPGDYLIRSVQISVEQAPSGSDIICDINVNGVSIFADQNARPRILDGQFSGMTVLPYPYIAVGAADALTVDIDQIGSLIPGSTLVAIVRAESA